jgi:hypothetical protein
MVVRSQCNGHRITGLYVGLRNARRYFPRNLDSIDLEIDHLRIQCGLTPQFWDDDPQIHDSRLCEWLELKQFAKQGYRHSMPLAMIPSGENSFVLRLGGFQHNRRPVRSVDSVATPVKVGALAGSAA